MNSGMASSGKMSRLPNIAEWIAWIGLMLSIMPASVATISTAKIGTPITSRAIGRMTSARKVMARSSGIPGRSAMRFNQRQHKLHPHDQRDGAETDRDERLRNPRRDV